MSNCRVRSIGVLAVAVLALTPLRASALQKFGPIQLSGNLSTQNLIRTPDASTYEFIQNRNTARIRLDYDWLMGGRFYNRIDVPFIESSHFFLLWRGVYDSIYDTTPGFLQKTDIKGRAYGGLSVFDFAHKIGNPALGRTLTIHELGLNGLSKNDRDALKFDNQLREMYADIKFRGLPLTVRAGRQQIVWGETDNFRMLDRANSLDLTWHFQQEIPAPAFGWDDIRRPFWMIKFLYDLGDVWKFNQSFLEWYWNPGDWFPAKQTFLPRPWGLPFYNPLTNPIDGVFISGVCDSSTVKRVGPGGRYGACTQLLGNTKLFNKGDYARNAFDNSQVGVRYHGIAPFGMEFTLNYFYQRFAGDDGTNYAPLRGLPKPVTIAEKNHVSDLLKRGVFPAAYDAPYVHTIGASANYSDETFTQAVFRAETIYDVGIPFFDVAKETAIDRPALPGVTKKNMWKGMIAFDRPTWIRSVNKKSTVFLTGQFFWHYMVNNPSCKIPDRFKPFPGAGGAGDVGTFLDSAGKRAVGSCLVGGLDLPSTVRPGTGDPRSPAYRDKIRDWETLATFAAFTFYRGGSVVPILGMAIDPTNQFNMEPFWTVDYFVTADVAVNVAQRYFITPRGRHEPVFETWGLAGLNAGRSETSIRLTYQF